MFSKFSRQNKEKYDKSYYKNLVHRLGKERLAGITKRHYLFIRNYLKEGVLFFDFDCNCNDELSRINGILVQKLHDVSYEIFNVMRTFPIDYFIFIKEEKLATILFEMKVYNKFDLENVLKRSITVISKLWNIERGFYLKFMDEFPYGFLLKTGLIDIRPSGIFFGSRLRLRKESYTIKHLHVNKNINRFFHAYYYRMRYKEIYTGRNLMEKDFRVNFEPDFYLYFILTYLEDVRFTVNSIFSLYKNVIYGYDKNLKTFFLEENIFGKINKSYTGFNYCIHKKEILDHLYLKKSFNLKNFFFNAYTLGDLSINKMDQYLILPNILLSLDIMFSLNNKEENYKIYRDMLLFESSLIYRQHLTTEVGRFLFRFALKNNLGDII